MDATVERVRSFNRTVTSSVGALDDHFLGRGRPLGEARLLWEIGDAGADVRELRRRLGLDSGYASRMLRSLEHDGLVSMGVDPGDARVRRAELTRRGRSERAELDRRARELAEGLLQPLDAGEQASLVDAMAVVERLLLRARITIAREPARSADVRWCFGRYFDELNERFESGFDVGRSMAVSSADLSPPSGLVLVARVDADPVGCGGLKLHTDGVAELKRVWVAPRVRGLGVGRRLLAALESEARAAGARVVRLETNRNLVEAITMYRRSGYREIAPFNDEPYAHHWFEKRLEQEPPHDPDARHDLERVRSRTARRGRARDLPTGDPPGAG